jgi:hypothetical protein
MTWLPIRWIVAPGYQVAAERAQLAVMPAMISSRLRDRAISFRPCGPSW